MSEEVFDTSPGFPNSPKGEPLRKTIYELRAERDLYKSALQEILAAAQSLPDFAGGLAHIQDIASAVLTATEKERKGDG